MPATDPPVTLFTATKNNAEHLVLVLADSPVHSLSYIWDTRLIFNVTGVEGAIGYFYAVFTRELMGGPYPIYTNQKWVNHSEIYAGGNAYVFLTFTHSANTALEIHQLITMGDSSAWGEPARPVESDA
jgi:hypothetical protein